MSAGSLGQRFARMLDLDWKNLLTLGLLSLIVGITEDEVAPFRSVIYIVVLFFIFHASVSGGMRQGVFLATGFLVLLMMGSTFRPKDAWQNFLTELPGDIFLFMSLGFLPGFFIYFYDCEVQDIKQVLAGQQARVRALRARLGQVGPDPSKKDAAAVAAKIDVRRGNSLAELVRNVMEAGDVTEIARGVGKAALNGMDPEALAVLVPSAGAFKMIPLAPEGITPGTLPADHPVVAAAMAAGKAVALPENEALDPTIKVNLICPLVAKGKLVSVIAVRIASSVPLDPEVKYLNTVGQIAQTLVARRMK